MKCKQPRILHASQVFLLMIVVLAIGVVSGCAQEQQVEKEPASRPNVSVDFDGPGNRVDAGFRGTSPE